MDCSRVRLEAAVYLSAVARSGHHPGPGAITIALYVAFGVVAVPRMVWFAAYYFYACKRRSPGVRRISALSTAGRALSADVWSGAADQRTDRHRRFVAATQRQQESLLISGSIALAAWTVLFTTATTFPAETLAPLTRNLLLAASITLLSGPLLFRASGRETTIIGREVAAATGYAAFVIALCSAVADLFGTTGAVIAGVLAAAVASRDLCETATLIQRYRTLSPTA